MSSITDLATKIEAAKLAGNGITLSADELEGFLSIAKLLGGSDVGSADLSLVKGAANAGPDMDPDEVVTIEEICSKLKITRQTLYRWRLAGKFPEPAVSKSRWLRSDFADWLRNNGR